MSRAMIFSCSLSFPYCTSVYIHLPRRDRHFAFLLGPQLCRVAIQCCSAAGARSCARALGTHSMHIRPLHCPWVWITVGSHTHCSPVTSGVLRLKFHTGKLWHWHVTFSISEYHIVLLQLCSESTSPSPFPLLYLIALPSDFPPSGRGHEILSMRASSDGVWRPLVEWWLLSFLVEDRIDSRIDREVIEGHKKSWIGILSCVNHE